MRAPTKKTAAEKAHDNAYKSARGKALTQGYSVDEAKMIAKEAGKTASAAVAAKMAAAEEAFSLAYKSAYSKAIKGGCSKEEAKTMAKEAGAKANAAALA